MFSKKTFGPPLKTFEKRAILRLEGVGWPGEPTAEKSSFLFHGFEARVVDDFDCRRAKGKLAARKSADPPPSPPAVTITVVSTENVLQFNVVSSMVHICSQMKRVRERSSSDRVQCQHLREDVSE